MLLSDEGQTALAHADVTLPFRNTRDLQQLATDAFERGARIVVVDMAATGYVDSAALRVLVSIASRLRRYGGTLCVANVNAELRAVLAATKLDAFLPIWSPAHLRAD
jgi:anti-anti-sigma factor